MEFYHGAYNALYKLYGVENWEWMIMMEYHENIMHLI